MTRPATTTPDPEFKIPPSGEPKKERKPPDHPQAQAVQGSGGGGAPGTGAQDEPNPRKIPTPPPEPESLWGVKRGTISSPGEGISETEAERAEGDDG
jgi:hypothetical protein